MSVQTDNSQRSSLFDREKEGIHVDLTVLEDVQSDYKFCLVGSVLTKRYYNRNHFKLLMSDLWRHPRGLIIKECGENRFLFRFSSEEDMQWVLDREPWSFERRLVLLAPVDGASPVSGIVLNSIPFWVRVYNLPFLSISKTMGRQIGNKMGFCDLVDCTVNGDSKGDYFRIRVRFDSTQPLWRRMLIHFDGQNDHWVEFSYERLPDLCYKCGMIDHWTTDCSLQGIPVPGEGRPFGSWLKAEIDPFHASRKTGRWRRKDKENLRFPATVGNSGDQDGFQKVAFSKSFLEVKKRSVLSVIHSDNYQNQSSLPCEFGPILNAQSSGICETAQAQFPVSDSTLFDVVVSQDFGPLQNKSAHSSPTSSPSVTTGRRNKKDLTESVSVLRSKVNEDVDPDRSVPHPPFSNVSSTKVSSDFGLTAGASVVGSAKLTHHEQ